jgi:hypothetical protein
MVKKVPVAQEAMTARLEGIMESLTRLTEEVQQAYATISAERKTLKHWQNKYYSLHKGYVRGRKKVEVPE